MIHITRIILEKLEKTTGIPVKRLVKFSLVGGSGTGVNMGLFFFLNETLSMPYQISSIIAIETSIITNFILNSWWTWQDRQASRRKEKGFRFLKYHLIVGFSALINYGILLLLVETTGLNKYLANLAGIMAAMGINFILNHKWTFRG